MTQPTSEDPDDTLSGHQMSWLATEYSQAWEHYRFLESYRTKALGFLFAVLFAVTGFFTAVAPGDLGSAWLYAGSVTSAWLIGAVASFVSIHVRKLGPTLDHYATVTRDIRAVVRRREFGDSESALFEDIDVYKRIRRSRSRPGHFGIQVSTEVFAWALCMGAHVAVLALGALALSRAQVAIGLGVLALAFLTLGIQRAIGLASPPPGLRRWLHMRQAARLPTSPS